MNIYAVAGIFEIVMGVAFLATAFAIPPNFKDKKWPLYLIMQLLVGFCAIALGIACVMKYEYLSKM